MQPQKEPLQLHALINCNTFFSCTTQLNSRYWHYPKTLGLLPESQYLDFACDFYYLEKRIG